MIGKELDYDSDFGARLRAERERLGLAVHELAHLGSRPEFTQLLFEAGEQPIPIDYLQALEARTDVDVMYLITGERAGADD